MDERTLPAEIVEKIYRPGKHESYNTEIQFEKKGESFGGNQQPTTIEIDA